MRIYKLKREIAEMRRAVLPLKEPMRQFADGRVEGVHDEARPFFGDVYDHVARTAEIIDELDSLLTAAFQAHLARISVQQNDDMRKISAGVALAAVPTLIAGVYGMNFDHMPELGWQFGYLYAIGLMGVIVGPSGSSSRSPAGCSRRACQLAGGGRNRSSSHIRACPIQPGDVVHQVAERVLGALERLAVAGRGLLRRVADLGRRVVLAARIAAAEDAVYSPDSVHRRSSAARTTANGCVWFSTRNTLRTESRKSSVSVYSLPWAKNDVASRSSRWPPEASFMW